MMPVESQAAVVTPLDKGDFDQLLADVKSGKLKLAEESPDQAIRPERTNPAKEAVPEPAAAESTQTQTDDQDEEPEAEPATTKRFRLQAHNAKDTAVFAVMKASGLSYDAAAESLFGKVAPASTESAPAAEETSQPVETVETIDAQIKALRVERRAAMASLDFDKVAELDETLFDLPTRRAELASRQAQAAVSADQQAVQEYTAFQEKAATLYPDSAVTTSPLYQRAEEIIATMTENRDPLLERNDVVLKVVQMAAAELGIAPSRAGAAAASVPVTGTPARAAPSPAPVKMRPASGSGQTTASPAGEAAAAEALRELSLDELRRVARRY